MTNPVLNTRNFAKISGIAVAAVALLGIVLSAIGSDTLLGEGFLAFDWTHNIVHVVLAAIGLYVGFAGTDALCTLYARVFGIVYLALGVTGFFWEGLVTPHNGNMLHLELGENLVHLLLGAWGCAAGFLATKTTTTPTPSPTPMRK